jgi:hypothetical protein
MSKTFKIGLNPFEPPIATAEAIVFALQFGNPTEVKLKINPAVSGYATHVCDERDSVRIKIRHPQSSTTFQAREHDFRRPRMPRVHYAKSVDGIQSTTQGEAKSSSCQLELGLRADPLFAQHRREHDLLK